jgi:DNA polymerase-3 subunit gamma/tau
VYIVDEAHMLTREAWNALLKILEEPPPGVVFVFATTEPAKIFNTAAPVLSRLQRFDFRRIGPTAIRDRLREVLGQERLAADEDALTLIAKHADGGMRDALSVLDQCLSFGEGAVTAARVHEVLGLVSDELYDEVLRAVIARQPAAIFPLVGRLLDSGADLAEFSSGLGEMLRSLLMLQVGATPEDLTEAMRRLLEEHRGALSDGDVLRMLRLLGESETAIRRSGNARLAVETLLLRWTLMDRTVDLEEVLAGRPPAGPTRAPPLAPATSPTPARAAPARSATRSELSVPALQAAWEGVVSQARGKSSFLGAALGAAAPVEVDGALVTLALAGENPIHREALERQRAAVEEILSALSGQPVTVRLARAAPPAAEARPARLTEAGMRAERLQKVRQKDPALDVAATELDLEVLE